MRRIVEDYEAKLRPPSGMQSGRGKIEWERDGDGNEELSARFRKLDIQDGASVEIRIDGTLLGHASVADGSGRLKFESARGDVVPKAVTGQVAQIVHDGVVVLEGSFEPD